MLLFSTVYFMLRKLFLLQLTNNVLLYPHSCGTVFLVDGSNNRVQKFIGNDDSAIGKSFQCSEISIEE